jgi:hypothetical protein
MKHFHEMMPTFLTEFCEHPCWGLGHTYKTAMKFRHLGFKNDARVIVPVIIEINISKENYHAFLFTVNHYFGKRFFSTKFHRLKN